MATNEANVREEYEVLDSVEMVRQALRDGRDVLIRLPGTKEWHQTFCDDADVIRYDLSGGYQYRAVIATPPPPPATKGVVTDDDVKRALDATLPNGHRVWAYVACSNPDPTVSGRDVMRAALSATQPNPEAPFALSDAYREGYQAGKAEAAALAEAPEYDDANPDLSTPTSARGDAVCHHSWPGKRVGDVCRHCYRAHQAALATPVVAHGEAEEVTDAECHLAMKSLFPYGYNAETWTDYVRRALAQFAKSRALASQPAEGQKESPWVAISERLPEVNQPVVLINVNRYENIGGADWTRHVQDCGYLAAGTYWSRRGARADMLDAYTHWAPMPDIAAIAPDTGEGK